MKTHDSPEHFPIGFFFWDKGGVKWIREGCGRSRIWRTIVTYTDEEIKKLGPFTTQEKKKSVSFSSFGHFGIMMGEVRSEFDGT